MSFLTLPSFVYDARSEDIVEYVTYTYDNAVYDLVW